MVAGSLRLRMQVMATVALAVAAAQRSWGGEPIPASLLGDTVEFYPFDTDLDASLLKPVAVRSGQAFWIAGTEATFLAPFVPGNTVATHTHNLGTDDELTVLDDVGLEMMTFAPRVWLGVNNADGWGLVGRFWYLTDTKYDQGRPTTQASHFTFDQSNQIKLYTIDLEVTRNFVWRNWLMTGSLGARYASVEYGSRLSQQSAFGAEVIWGLAFADAESYRAFDGTGLTFALGGRKPWAPNSAMHWIWNARGSAIFGDARYTVRSKASTMDMGGTDVANSADAIRFYDTLFIAEIQAGLQWEHSLQVAPATAFFRVVCEYQYWGGVNDEYLATSTSSGGVSSHSDAAAWARGLNIGLIGLSLGTGFTW